MTDDELAALHEELLRVNDERLAEIRALTGNPTPEELATSRRRWRSQNREIRREVEELLREVEEKARRLEG